MTATFSKFLKIFVFLSGDKTPGDKCTVLSLNVQLEMKSATAETKYCIESHWPNGKPEAVSMACQTFMTVNQRKKHH